MNNREESAIGAGLPLSEAAGRNWDVLVAGAGPAGALTAYNLARQGGRVLLVDKASYPRWKVCGCCLNGATLRALEVAGLGALPKRLGGVPLQRLELHVRGQEAVIGLPIGMALSRQALDAALVAEAIAAGATFLPQTEASWLSADERQSRVRLQQGTEEVVASASVTVAADGLGGRFLRARPDMSAAVSPQAPVGLGAIVESPPDCYAPHTIYMACSPGGYVGAVRLEDGRLDLAAALDRRRLQDSETPAAAVSKILQENGLCSPPGLESLHFRGTPPLTRRRRHVAAERLFVLGDAAGYLEPFTGEGMSWATQQSLLLTPIVMRAAAGWSAGLAEQWQSCFERFLKERQGVCRVATWLVRRPVIAQAAVATLRRFPGLAGPWVHAVNRPCAGMGAIGK